jgi:hypothetical protein
VSVAVPKIDDETARLLERVLSSGGADSTSGTPREVREAARTGRASCAGCGAELTLSATQRSLALSPLRTVRGFYCNHMCQRRALGVANERMRRAFGVGKRSKSRVSL